MNAQKSAEGILALPTRSEGPNLMNRKGTLVSMMPVDAEKMTEMSEQPGW